MLSLFQRKRVPPTTGTPPTSAIEAPKGLMRPESAASLLATPRRQKLLEHIWQRTSLSRRQFATLYLAPLERYAELVQQFPASENHHHAYPGGMLDHGLEIVAYALKLRQSYLLPAGVTPEAQAAQAEAWTAGTAYAALLHDIGKIAVDLHVEHADGSIWHPWHGPLRKPYRFRYRKEREYRLHSAATGLLYAHLLDRDIFDWLSGYPDLWAALLYVLAGQYEHAGTLGELVVQADQASVAQELGGDPSKALTAPRHALQRKLLDGLRYLLKEELKLNHGGPADGWLTQDALWLVSKTVSDKLRAHLLSQGVDGIPANNTAVFNVLQDHGIVQPTPDGKAIWKAAVTSDTGWSHAFTFLKLSPAVIWDAADRPAPFAGRVQVEEEQAEPTPQAPAVPDGPRAEGIEAASASTTPIASAAMDTGVAALLDLLGDTAPPPAPEIPSSPVAEPEPAPSTVPPPQMGLAPAQDRAEPSGAHFMAWLRQSIQTRKLIINDAKALVHTVAGTTYLVSPGVFQRYAQEYLQVAALAKQEKLEGWQWVQKRFEKLGQHRKQPSGLNIWTCEVTGPRKSRRLHGYLLASPEALFREAPPDNPYLRLLNEAAKREDSALGTKDDDQA
ncbi:relaxase [Denitratisoma sp. DHT3]|uniref:MobH family relaxase n=1 Tax=Denitratisoma sp. DHT3 TaxID=1981880 RepID=UPI001198B80F|nr:MobH family relaxase [Denitratisoma sp. DHT3]QDX81531.1 relaxase [Denitratisoma sp. DHT3]